MCWQRGERFRFAHIKPSNEQKSKRIGPARSPGAEATRDVQDPAGCYSKYRPSQLMAIKMRKTAPDQQRRSKIGDHAAEVDGGDNRKKEEDARPEVPMVLPSDARINDGSNWGHAEQHHIAQMPSGPDVAADDIRIIAARADQRDDSAGEAKIRKQAQGRLECESDTELCVVVNVEPTKEQQADREVEQLREALSRQVDDQGMESSPGCLRSQPGDQGTCKTGQFVASSCHSTQNFSEPHRALRAGMPIGVAVAESDFAGGIRPH